jgi:transcription elongation GreA/GreB family factor
MRWNPLRTPGGHLPSAFAGTKDARDNEDLEAILDERERRIRDAARPPAGSGAQVRVRDGATGGEHLYDLVVAGQHEPAAGRISVESPVGRALLGRRAGQLAEVVTPGGIQRLMVLEVTLPEGSGQ